MKKTTIEGNLIFAIKQLRLLLNDGIWHRNTMRAHVIDVLEKIDPNGYYSTQNIHNLDKVISNADRRYDLHDEIEKKDK